jgi:hypothetical protein
MILVSPDGMIHPGFRRSSPSTDGKGRRKRAAEAASGGTFDGGRPRISQLSVVRRSAESLFRFAESRWRSKSAISRPNSEILLR